MVKKGKNGGKEVIPFLTRRTSYPFYWVCLTPKRSQDLLHNIDFIAFKLLVMTWSRRIDKIDKGISS